MSRPNWRRLAGAVGLFAALLLIARLTLQPAHQSAPVGSRFCLICGEKGLADALLNILLFLPAGCALGLLGLRTRWSALAGFAASFLIEAVQFFLPGRDASPGDLLTNTLGTAIGAALVVHAAGWTYARAWRMRLLLVTWSALLLPGCFGAAVLLRPAPTTADWYVQWAPVLGHFGRFRGRVERVDLDGETFLPVRYPASALHTQIFGGSTITAHVKFARPPQRIVPLLTIYDADQREIFLLAAHQHDLVIRHATLGERLRLDQPELRVHDALDAVDTSMITRVDVRREGAGWRVRAVGRDHGIVAYGLEDGYRFLIQSQRRFSAHPRLLATLWLLFWFLPLGFWTRTPLQRACAAALAAAAALLPAITGISFNTAATFVALAAVAAGIAARALLEHAQRRPSRTADARAVTHRSMRS